MRLALRLFWRDWRGGELGMLFTALLLAVAIVSALALFVERVQRAVELRSATFLAGDLVLRASRPVQPQWLREAEQAGLRQAQLMNFSSMAFAGEQMQLVSIKAVSANYPLLGHLVVSSAPGAPTRELARGPGAGEVWVDARLLSLIGVAVGDTIGIGETNLRITEILHREPDASGSLLALGPRVMMNMADIAASAVVQPGSRVQYAYLFAGSESAIGRWRARIEPQMLPAQRLLTVDDAQPRMARSIDRARSFLLLAGSLGVVLAGVALAMAARRYTERHADYVAILKTLGLGGGAIARIYGGNLLLLSVAGIASGYLAGWVLQWLAFVALADFVGMSIPSAGLASLQVAAGTGLICMLALVGPSLGAMARASPLRVLRRDLEASTATWGLYASGLLALLLLLMWYSRDVRLSLVVLSCLLLCSAVVGGFAYGLLSRARLPGVQAHSALRLALAGLQRHAVLNALQILVFALSLMLVLLMVLVRTALIEDWRRELPPGTPNYFLVNIAPYQMQPVEEFLLAHGIRHAGLYPMVPGRLLEVNGEPARVQEGEELNIDREFNLTWSEQLPADNRLTEGQWWGEDVGEEVSVEAGVMRALGLKLGDRLGLQIGAERLEARISSVRELDWDSMRPNFFLIFPRQLLERHASTSITSFYLPAARKSLLNQMLRQWPTISVLEMDAILDQLRGITRQLTLAVEWVMLLLLVAAALVAVASVRSGLDARFRESAILRALGAGRRLVLGGLVLEFALIGLIAGVLATVGAELAAWYVQTRLMELAFRLHPLVWLIGPPTGALVAATLGLLSCRSVVNTAPISVLRALD